MSWLLEMAGRSQFLTFDEYLKVNVVDDDYGFFYDDKMSRCRIKCL